MDQPLLCPVVQVAGDLAALFVGGSEDRTRASRSCSRRASAASSRSDSRATMTATSPAMTKVMSVAHSLGPYGAREYRGGRWKKLKTWALTSYEREGVLGPDLLLVHCIRVNNEEIGHLARTRTPVSISILSNLRCGMGLPPVLAMMRGGVDVSLSLDTMAAADCADMFNAMRITMGIERAKADDGSVYQPREALAQATTQAAATLGLGDVTGALRAGLKADVMLLRASDLNMAPLNVLDGQVVLAAQPQNVDTVFIDGVLRKRAGELVGLDRRALVDDVTQAMADLNA